MANVTMRELLEAGIHFGHQTRRWNPKMKKYIYGARNGIYIIDLSKTLKQLIKAHNIIRDTVADGGNVLFVATKKQAIEPVEREAQRCGMFYVTTRWLGGTLTNFETMRRGLRKLQHFEEMEAKEEFDTYSKKEGAQLRKEYQRLHTNLGGMKGMEQPPDIMFVIDTRRETIAVREAQRLGIESIGIVDTNCDPDSVSLPIPGNDDAIRALNLYCKFVADAVLEGKAVSDKRREAEREKLHAELQAKAASEKANESGESEEPAEEAAE